jgi:1-acyl-sn-glycerol-3-phosphate acyltransferase
MRHLLAVSRLCAAALWSAALYALRLVLLSVGLVSRRAAVRADVAAMRAWARGLARLIGMRIRVEGPPPRPPFLLAANHLSYVDVVALLASTPCVFLAKSEVARWPVIGFLARTTGNLFVDRSRRGDLPRVLAAVEAAVARGRGVAIFPEGTSTDGSAVLPFKPSLFEAAVRTGLPVSCASLGYEVPDGYPPARLSVCWWGDMEFLRHLYALLQIPSFEARVAFADVPIARGEWRDRKELAAQARRRVEARFTPVVSPSS